MQLASYSLRVGRLKITLNRIQNTRIRAILKGRTDLYYI